MAGELTEIIDLLGRRQDPGGTNIFIPSMKGARERKVGPLAEEFRRMGLPWKADELMGTMPEEPGSMSVAGRNLGHVFSGGRMQRAEPGPFDRAWTPDDFREVFRAMGRSEEEAENYIDRVELNEWLLLKHQRDEALAADPHYRRLQAGQMDAEEEEILRRRYIGAEPLPEESVTVQAGAWRGPASATSLEEGFMVPRGIHNIPPGGLGIGPDGKTYYNRPPDKLLPYNYVDSETGKVVNYTTDQMIELQQQYPGRYTVEPKQVHELTGKLHPTMQKEVEKEFFQLIALRDNLAFIQKSFDPDWLSYEGRAEGWLMELGSHLKALSPEQKIAFMERSGVVSAAAKVTNDMIRLMTGAQMSHKEAQRLMLQEINVTGDNPDSPDQFIGKLMKTMYFANLAIARNRMVMEKGLLKTEQMTREVDWERHLTMEGFRNAVFDEANEMYEKAAGDKATKLKDVRGAMMEKYGIDPWILEDKWISDNLPLGDQILEGITSLHREEQARKAIEVPQ
jgi:hypothetical protein